MEPQMNANETEKERKEEKRKESDKVKNLAALKRAATGADEIDEARGQSPAIQVPKREWGG